MVSMSAVYHPELCSSTIPGRSIRHVLDTVLSTSSTVLQSTEVVEGWRNIRSGVIKHAKEGKSHGPRGLSIMLCVTSLSRYRKATLPQKQHAA